MRVLVTPVGQDTPDFLRTIGKKRFPHPTFNFSVRVRPLKYSHVKIVLMVSANEVTNTSMRPVLFVQVMATMQDKYASEDSI